MSPWGVASEVMGEEGIPPWRLIDITMSGKFRKHPNGLGRGLPIFTGFMGGSPFLPSFLSSIRVRNDEGITKGDLPQSDLPDRPVSTCSRIGSSENRRNSFRPWPIRVFILNESGGEIVIDTD
jgi:hypothetical protein